MKRQFAEFQNLTFCGDLYQATNIFRDVSDLKYLGHFDVGDQDIRIFERTGESGTVYVLNDYLEGQRFDMDPRDVLKNICDEGVKRGGSAERASDYFEGNAGEICRSPNDESILEVLFAGLEYEDSVLLKIRDYLYETGPEIGPER